MGRLGKALVLVERDSAWINGSPQVVGQAEDLLRSDVDAPSAVFEEEAPGEKYSLGGLEENHND